jgi:arylsulfatase A-like enzyme
MTTHQANSRPNILIILSDQLRRQALGCYGDPDARTPHIDQLAQHSVRFANACSTYPICVPFRFTMMTGEYAHTRLVPGIEWVMSPAERTLADEFNDAGYHTAYVGKWHLAGGHGRMGSAAQCGRTPVRPMHQGRWQKWLGFELRNDPFDTYYFEDADPTPRPLNKYQTDGLFDLGMEHLANGWDRSSPFCMCLSVEPPHDPFVAPADLQAAWEARSLELPANFSAQDEATRQRVLLDRKRYYAMVENLDQNVGRMRSFLAAQGLADNTVLVFVSDHGELSGSHGLRAKQWPYEESVGIPLIVYDPRVKAPAGTVLNDPTCTEDLFPTFLGLAGLSPKNPLPGINLAPLIQGTQAALSRQSVLLEFVAEHRAGAVFNDAVWRAVRTRRFKYVVKGDKFGAEAWFFFDLENDPGEQNNLLEDPNYQEQITKHHHLLCDHLITSQDPFVLLPAYGCAGVNTWE